MMTHSSKLGMWCARARMRKWVLMYVTSRFAAYMPKRTYMWVSPATWIVHSSLYVSIYIDYPTKSWLFLRPTFSRPRLYNTSCTPLKGLSWWAWCNTEPSTSTWGQRCVIMKWMFMVIQNIHILTHSCWNFVEVILVIKVCVFTGIRG